MTIHTLDGKPFCLAITEYKDDDGQKRRRAYGGADLGTIMQHMIEQQEDETDGEMLTELRSIRHATEEESGMIPALSCEYWGEFMATAMTTDPVPAALLGRFPK